MDIHCVYTTNNSIEADLIKAQLESAGIDCFLRSDDAGGALPHLTFSNGIGIMVREEEEEKATQIIQDWFSRESEENS